MNGGPGRLTRLLSSPRRRRRLRLVALLLALAGVLAFVGVRWSNTASRSKETFEKGPVQRVAPAPKSAALSADDRDAVRKTAALFIDSAVLRRKLDASWPITTRNLHQGLTRRQWDSGNIPVAPFVPASAVRLIRYRLDWSGENIVYLKVAILPKGSSSAEGQAYDIGLARTGRPGDHAWLVDYWVPSGLSVPSVKQQTKADAAGAVAESTAASNKLPAGFILLPVGLLLTLIIGLPLVVFGRNWTRSRRADRDYRQHHT
jgi:hypothetical protein